MATTTRQASPASAEPEPGEERLHELLALPPSEVELRATALVPRLERATLAELTPGAARLVDLLDDETFARATPALREAIVRAVLRLGYPWALQLPPDDLTLLRREQTTARAARLRRGLVVALAVAALAAGALSWALLSQPARALPRPAPTGPRSFVLPTLEQVLPAATRAEAAEALMREWSAQGRYGEALRLGLDCLADASLPPSTCLTGLVRTVDARNQRVHDRGQRPPVTSLPWSARWTVADVQNPPPGTLSFLRELEHQAADDVSRELPPEMRAEADARAALGESFVAVGDARAAITEATACLGLDADAIDCHLILLAAHDMLGARASPSERAAHGVQVESERRELLRLVLRQKRLACGTTPDPKPLGCRLGPAAH